MLTYNNLGIEEISLKINLFKLFVIATPIGHLADITHRAVACLEESSLILCEDKRVTAKLLNHYQIKTPLQTYNSYQEQRQEKLEKQLSNLFKKHTVISLVSDAGTPSISDPGYVLINFCHKHEIAVIPLPGPSAGISCLSVSGFQTKNVLFYGFLPNKKGKRKRILENLLNLEKKVIILYESPHRIENLLKNLVELNDNIRVFIGREMTKKFEEFITGTAKQALNQLLENKMRGEFVVILDNSN